jgi:hypothetical protein
MANDNTQGLLSFLFHVRYDEVTRKELHLNEKSAMNRFGLSEAVQALLVQMGELASSGSSSPADRDKARVIWKQLLDEHLSNELADDQGAIW